MEVSGSAGRQTRVSDQPGMQRKAKMPAQNEKEPNRKNIPKPSERDMAGVQRAMMNWKSHWQQAV
jgi:hypothetical protein